jgi:hypothetical protein
MRVLMRRFIPYVQAKLLCGMWLKAAAPALALLDQQKILQRMRAAFAQDARRSSSVCSAGPNQHRLRCGPNPATGGGAANHRKKIRLAA